MEEILERAEKEGVDAVVAGMEKLHESMDVKEDGDVAAEEDIQVRLPLSCILNFLLMSLINLGTCYKSRRVASPDWSIGTWRHGASNWGIECARCITRAR